MDPWISSQPSLSLDLHVGLPPMGHPHHHHSHHQAAPMVALAKPKILVEENFMPLKKDPEVGTHVHSETNQERHGFDSACLGLYMSCN